MLTQYVVLALAASALAVPYSAPYVLHEQRVIKLHGRTTRVSSEAIIPIRIGLTQSNLGNAYGHLLAVSDPASSNYGKHWTQDEVHSMFAPSEQTYEAVKVWLISAGVDPGSISTTANQGWLAVNMPVSQAESLFKTEYFEHEDSDGGITRLGCDSYHLPSHLAEHVDFIKPGVALSKPVKRTTITKKSNLASRRSTPPIRDPHRSKPVPGPKPNNVEPDLSNCGQQITPACIKALYAIPDADTFVSDPANALGIFEDDDVYAQLALDLFFKNFAPNVPQGTHPIPTLIDGTKVPVSINDTQNMGESDVDLSLAYSLLYPQKIVLYQSLDEVDVQWDLKTVEQIENAATSFTPFLDAIDGSYCTDVDKRSGLQCGAFNLTRVVSISYGAQELNPISGSIAAQQRACNEIAKLGLQGTTFVVSSGDYGVATKPSGKTNGCATKTSNGTDVQHGGDLFVPSFPATCPFVLAVGATQLTANQTVADPESVMELPKGEVPVAGVNTTFTSGGGFANYFDAPSYQTSAIKSYFGQHDPGYPFYRAVNGTGIGADNGRFNRGGRGIPDVSANGAHLVDFASGEPGPVFGTSLAAPIWASIITLINEKRCEAGKGPVGFVNPTLYANPHAFKDITVGNNPGCNSRGFSAVPGWDPTTGLGTPDFPSLLDVFLRLP